MIDLSPMCHSKLLPYMLLNFLYVFKHSTVSKGYFCGGTVPYGYKVVKVADGKAMRSRLVPDDMKAPIVRRIFEECLSGKGMKEITK